MRSATYRDLAEFGLPLVTPADDAFRSLARDIETRPQPFGAWPTEDLSSAAVLLNQSGKAILGISFLWRYTTATGEVSTNHYSNLGSSTQLEVLTGRSHVVEDLGSFILAGSKRLITERGMFGNNLDVLKDERPPYGGGYIGAGRAGVRTATSDAVAVELALDLPVLEDGRCVGPDEAKLFESLIEDLERIRSSAQEASNALRNGASAGQVFEMLRPIVRQAPRGTARARARSPFFGMFGSMAIHQLVNSDSPLLWFETQAQPSRLGLYRPS